jgi:metal-sulfur cluster biosynthetic enzyme
MVTEQQIYDAISTVVDPEVGFNLVEMGLIYGVDIGEDGNVMVTMTLSTRACPLHQMIVQWVKEACEKVEGVHNCEVNVVWEPAWNITMAADNVKQALGG